MNNASLAIGIVLNYITALQQASLQSRDLTDAELDQLQQAAADSITKAQMEIDKFKDAVVDGD